MLTRAIPSTGEAIPAIGLGTWQTFDVGGSERERAPLAAVLRDFFAAGGRVIDSSPMYGKAEAAIGAMLGALREADPDLPAPFLATKVWTEGKKAGEQQMRRSMQRMGATFEGIHRKHRIIPGLGVRDTAWYALLDDEWPAVRDGLRTRLDRQVR